MFNMPNPGYPPTGYMYPPVGYYPNYPTIYQHNSNIIAKNIFELSNCNQNYKYLSIIFVLLFLKSRNIKLI